MKGRPARRIPLFRQLEIETRSTCSRYCPTCLRNSYPDREAVRPWFEVNELALDTIERILDETSALGFHGPLCLQHYNEPLEDPRIPHIARMAKEAGAFSPIFLCTNADLLTSDTAAELDGIVDELRIDLYEAPDAGGRDPSEISRLFHHSRLVFTGGFHIATHFSPAFDVHSLANAYRTEPCLLPSWRLIVNHRGDMLFCCEDLVGHFNLGSVHLSSIEELWFGEAHQDLVLALGRSGGRSCHPHCLSCPREPISMDSGGEGIRV